MQGKFLSRSVATRHITINSAKKLCHEYGMASRAINLKITLNLELLCAETKYRAKGHSILKLDDPAQMLLFHDDNVCGPVQSSTIGIAH